MSIFSVTKFKDIEEKLVPFFDKYPLEGAKSFDYADFREVAKIIKEKGHLTEEGLQQIQKIKSGMNKGRTRVSDDGAQKTSLSPQTKKISLGISTTLSENKRYYSTTTIFNTDQKNDKIKFDQWLVFTDGEGCFLINIRPNPKLKTGYSIELVFKITLHSRDRALLEKIKSFFGVGTVTVRSDGCVQYWVGSIKDLQVIVNHFDSYPLISQKWSDYQLFKQVEELIKLKQHLTKEGLEKIVSIKAVLNNGLSDQLKAARVPWYRSCHKTSN